jgi:multidrug efflux pump subunit AcrA (membrane-fusion protein)
VNPRSGLRCRSAWAVALLLLAGALSLGCENKSKAAKGEEPVPVVLEPVEILDIPREVAAFGTVEASSTVDVRSQVRHAAPRRRAPHHGHPGADSLGVDSR